MDENAALFAKVIAAYEAEGLPDEKIGQRRLPENDAADLIDLVRKYQAKRIMEVAKFVGGFDDVDRPGCRAGCARRFDQPWISTRGRDG
jgi:hypothetical protein